MNMLDANTYSVIGLYLTLAGLLGTFFYVHLSSWLQDLLRLKAKWKVNQRGTDSEQKAAIRECRFELKGLYNHVPILTALLVSGFVGFLGWESQQLLSAVPKDELGTRLGTALSTFLWLYYALTGYLLIHGLWLGFQMNREMKPNAPQV